MRIVFLLGVVILSFSAIAQQDQDSIYVSQHYEKFEYQIPMRDGIRLFTVVYLPRDKSRKYPILLNRTCYNASNYANYELHGHPSKFLVEDKYILAFQDVRGRYMSEGLFDNMTPNIPGNDPKNKKAVDESSDTWDTIDWMIKNLQGNNGRVGMYGISYPGFYTAAALPHAHLHLFLSTHTLDRTGTVHQNCADRRFFHLLPYPQF